MTNPATPTPTDLPEALRLAEALENPINVVCQRTVAAELRRLHAALSAAAPAVPAEGWTLVPNRATAEMQAAWDQAPHREDGDEEFHGAYRALIAAAPTAPQAGAPAETREQAIIRLMTYFGRLQMAAHALVEEVWDRHETALTPQKKYGVPYGAVVNLQEALYGIESKQCKIPPQGWYCTRSAGHEGPCAAIELNSAAQPSHPTRNMDSTAGVPDADLTALAPWRSAVLDLIDDCPGLSMEQDQWLSRRVKELDFPSAARPQAGAESYPPRVARVIELGERVAFEAAQAVKQFCEGEPLTGTPETARQLKAEFVAAVHELADATAALRARGAVPSDVRKLQKALISLRAKRGANWTVEEGQVIVDAVHGIAAPQPSHPTRNMDSTAGVPAQAGAESYPPMPEPDSYLFQHEETGQTQYVDAQQVEWGFEKNNPRLHRIVGAFTESQMHAYADATAALRARGAVPSDEEAHFQDWFSKDPHSGCRVEARRAWMARANLGGGK